MDVPFFGGCACGAVRYECSAAPRSMVNCHCRDCQRAGGGSSSPTVVVPAAAFTLLKGEPKIYSVTADSGHTARRAFCADCGSPLFALTSAREDFMGIRAGSLDDPSWFRPQAEMWRARSPGIIWILTCRTSPVVGRRRHGSAATCGPRRAATAYAPTHCRR